MSSSHKTNEFNKQVVVVLQRLFENGEKGGSFTISMNWNDTILTIQNLIRQRTGVPHDRVDVVYKGKKLPQYSCLHQISSGNMICLSYYCHSVDPNAKSWIRIAPFRKMDQTFLESLEEARNGFSIGIKPELSLYGSGGTYFFLNVDKWKCLTFKPDDEEPFAENNPRDLQGVTGHSGFRKGIRSGEGWQREIAAYLIDRERLFSVPATVQGYVKHPYFSQRCPSKKYKRGSLQLFIDEADLCSDWSSSLYSTYDVQRIAFLDMYILNTDRNDANILVQRKRNRQFLLIPIDHGYSLPDRLELNESSWCWLLWKQMKEPWDERIIQYVSRISIEDDVRMLNEALGIRKVCLIMLRVSGLLLKKGIQQGLTGYELALLYIRMDETPEKPSVLEEIIQECVERVKHYQILKKTNKDSITKCHSFDRSHDNKTDTMEMIKLTSSLSFPGFPYSEDYYCFPPEIEYLLINNKDTRHLFFSFLSDSLEFWIHTIKSRRDLENEVLI